MAFNIWRSLGYGVGRMRERPLDALRIWALDSLVVGIMLVALLILASQDHGGALTASRPDLPFFLSLLTILAMLVAFLGHLCSEAAWARFLATDERTPFFAYRIGSDEWRIFGSMVALIAVFAIIAMLVAIPFILIGMVLGDGGVALPGAAVQLLPFVLLTLLGFVLARTMVVPMLVVRRKDISPFAHFSATRGFWFRLGLVIVLVAGVSFVTAHWLPGALAGLAGMQAPGRFYFGVGLPNTWLEWLGGQWPVGPAHFAIAAIGVAGGGFFILVMRGAAAHAALVAPEPEASDVASGARTASAG